MDSPMLNPPSLADNYADNFLQWGSRKRMRYFKVEVNSDPNTSENKKSIIRADRHLVRAEKETTGRPFEEEQGHKQVKSKESKLIPSEQKLSHNQVNIKSKETILIPSEQKLRHNQVKIKSKETILIPSEQKLRHNQVKNKSVFQSDDLKLSMPYKDSTTINRNFGSSPEKSTRLHHLSNGVCTRSTTIDETDKISADGAAIQDKSTDLETFVWPKFHLTLSHSEKEEDFQAMKSAKLPLRPKKRSKLAQKSINAVSPGCWLGDISQDRYQVREKKSTKKRTKGLKAMQSVDSDLE